MTVDPSKMPPVSSGDVVSATDLRTRFQELERFVNGGIELPDLSTLTDDDSLFSSRHMVKPEFYSTANSRIKAVSSDVYYRNTFFSSFNRYVRHEITGAYITGNDGFNSSDVDDLPHSAWTPVDGMSATVDVKGSSDVTAYVNGSLYAYGIGSNDGITMTLKDASENYSRGPSNGRYTSETQESGVIRALISGKILAAFKLYVDKMDGNGPLEQAVTERWIYNTGERSYKFRRQQVSFAVPVTLSPGQNKISYRCIYRLGEHDSLSFKHLFIDNRNFFVDVHYK